MPKETGTRERLLDVAEALFSTQGIGATSLRALTREAGVNLAAVHYHFGSKDALLDAVVGRRAKPVNDERMAALARARAAVGGGAPRVEDTLRAFLMPGLRSLEAEGDGRKRLSRLVARIEAQPPETVETLWRKHFGEVGQHFLESIQEALPHLPGQLVTDRFRFAMGTLSYLFSGNFDLDIIPGHPTHPVADTARVAQVIGFLAAGLQAPALSCSSYVATLEAAP
jgi:AcrR family transcriptional regulator